MVQRNDQPRTPLGAAASRSRRTPPAVLTQRFYWLALLLTAGAMVCAAMEYRPLVLASVFHAIPASGGGGVRVAEEELRIAGAEKTPVFSRHFMGTAPEAPSVHASTIARLPDGALVAAWFGGTREGAADVSIYLSRWVAQTRGWEPPRVLTDRSQSSRELGRYVKKLGNPVLFCDSSGRLWLYYVTVSVGGWSGGSISLKHSDDQGETWSDARRIITSPFLNTSNLVRSTPLGLTDGGVLLPVYHEFIYQFGELLHLDGEGQLVHKYRMNSGGDSLQPTLVPLSSKELIAFYRRGAKSRPHVLFNRSLDGGQTWSEIGPSDLPNPNASVAALRTHSGEMLMALNPSESSREQLALAASVDGENWRMLTVLESGDPGQEFSYPSLIRGEPGEYHLIYTWNRERICHMTFNDAWLEASR